MNTQVFEGALFDDYWQQQCNILANKRNRLAAEFTCMASEQACCSAIQD